VEKKEILANVVQILSELKDVRAIALKDRDLEKGIRLIVVVNAESIRLHADLVNELIKRYPVIAETVSAYLPSKELYNSIFRTGDVLWGVLNPDIVHLGLRAYKIVTYDISKVSQTVKSRVTKRVYGRKSKKKIGEKEYSYKYKGLKDEDGVHILSQSTLLLPDELAHGFLDFLKHSGVAHKHHDVWY
jgi:hypothetical protein